jgi:hypothetical protein
LPVLKTNVSAAAGNGITATANVSAAMPIRAFAAISVLKGFRTIQVWLNDRTFSAGYIRQRGWMRLSVGAPRSPRMHRVSRRQVLRGAAAAITLGAPSVRAQNDRQTLRFVAQADLKTLDPISTTAYITRNHGYVVYDTPVRHGRAISGQAANGRSDHRFSGRHEVHVHAA